MPFHIKQQILIFKSEIFKFSSSDTTLKNSLLFFKWKEQPHPRKFGIF